ncbi:MAG: preprotein translocase subunit SecA, partial [Coriobacteriia bacterium]|nr:preprotein translocase subunit SecA [Coriobacteriia bacterium]
MANLFSKLLSLGSDKDLKRFEQKVKRINEIEPRYSKMSDEELFSQTARFKERLENGETLDDLLFEAFATMRETSIRVHGMRHFDVQLIGGMALHEGMIAEMRTGEGKTLVSTLAGYLNALAGKGVHIVTVNDYLAKRDSEWMGRLYEKLGMKVGLLQNDMLTSEKKPNYLADVTYGTNSEFGFDYLRDNMVTRAEDRVQRGHYFAIVDEVDSILIDEARTPLIISGAGARSSETYSKFAEAVRNLKEKEDFDMDEAKHTIVATEEGLSKIERRLGVENIYADLSGQLVNHLQQALKAEYMFHLDVNYVVMDGEVKIVDEFTGRIMEGRRYSDGLHQALEAKEGVLVRSENQTLATITLQNYFRLYSKLSGMTGTALTEDSEFRQIYNLKVQPIPTNKPIQRIDEDDLVYRTVDAKFNAVADEITKRHKAGQPVLVGTVSIESSERLSRILSKRGIKHEILNAKQHEREASIVAQAGRAGAVTIATNMAGRGTDILLGGNPEAMVDEYLKLHDIDPEEASEAQREDALAHTKALTSKEKESVLAAGGLVVIGTER